MSRNNVRKLATFVSMILNGFCILGLAYSGCNIISAVFFFTLSLALHGAVSTGALASMVDIAPNYAGLTMGLASTVAIMSGFVSPIIVGYITYENQSILAWQRIFEIGAGMALSCGIIYMIFNDTSVQPWNRGQSEDDDVKSVVQYKKVNQEDDIIVEEVENDEKIKTSKIESE